MGMIVNVLKNALGDCTNGGISGSANYLCVVNVDGPFEPTEKYPAAILTTNQVGNPVIKPAEYDKTTYADGSAEINFSVKEGWFMMGGNFAYTSDSRFGKALRKMGANFYGAIPIHDRQEW